MDALVKLGVSVQRFRNVDLFEKGLYCVKCFVEIPGPGCATDPKLVSVTDGNVDTTGMVSAQYPGKLISRGGIGFETQQCEIHYSDDEFNVHTGFDCTLKFPVPLSEALHGTLAQHKVALRFELHFNAKDPYALRKVATKTLRLHEVASRGMLQAATVSFDFFHTCSLDVAVCGMLLGFTEWKKPGIGANAAEAARRLSVAGVAGVLSPIRRRLTQDFGEKYVDCTVESPQNDCLDTSDVTLLPSYEEDYSRSPKKPTSSKGKGPLLPEMLAPHLNEEVFGDMSLEDLGNLVSLLGSGVADGLTKLVDTISAVQLDSIEAMSEVARHAAHAANMVTSTVASEQEKMHLGLTTFEEFRNVVVSVNAEVRELTAVLWQDWAPILMWTTPLLTSLRYQHRCLSLSRLLHGGFVWEQPRRALLKVKRERGQNLLVIASRVRHSRFYSVLSPPPLEDTTESVMPKHGPMLFEYRYLGVREAEQRRGRAGTGGEMAAAAAVRQRDRPEVGGAPAPSAGAAQAFTLDSGPDEPEDLVQAAAEMRRHVGVAAKMMEQTHPRHPELCEAFRTSSGAGGRGHFVVCVHGLAGNQYDLRLIRLQLQLTYPHMTFLMSSVNTTNTHASFETMADRFVDELKDALDRHSPQRVSFIGHSLGNLIIRAALSRPAVQELFQLPARLRRRENGGGAGPRQHGAGASAGPAAASGSTRPTLVTYVSFAAPHAGAVYLNGMVSAGMWLMSRWNRSSSLSALAWTDDVDPRRTFIYKLSKTNSLLLFSNVVFVGSPQDKYVNIASALLHSCPQSASDQKYGPVFEEIVRNIIDPLQACDDLRVSRIYVALAPGPKSMASMIGRAAHIAVLDEELVAQKVGVAIAHYFR